MSYIINDISIHIKIKSIINDISIHIKIKSTLSDKSDMIYLPIEVVYIVSGSVGYNAIALPFKLCLIYF